MTGSGTLGAIQGVLTNATDADVYLIDVTDPSGFSASTVGGAGFDTQLFLFLPGGRGVAGNDDSAGTTQSTLQAGENLVLAGGRYLLAVAGYDRDPVSVGGEIFTDASTGVVGPNGPGGSAPLSGFSGGGQSGPYTIRLTGASFMAFAPRFSDVRIANRLDQDDDGFARQFDVEFDVDSNVPGLYLVNVYEDDGGSEDDFLLASETFAADGTVTDFRAVTIVADRFPDVAPAPVTATFDEIDAAGQPQGVAVAGSLSVSLRGLTTDSFVAVFDGAQIYGGGALVPVSAPNVLLQVGPERLSYTMRFTTLLAALTFTRPELRPGPGGIVFPSWTATAFDAAGNVLGSVGQDVISSFAAVPAQTFTLRGPGIDSVRFDGTSGGFAAFAQVVIDDVTIVPAAEDLLGHGTASLRLDLTDAATGLVVETWRAGNDPDLASVRVEQSREDGASTWAERGDAGETVATAQATTGAEALDVIQGTIGGSGDADLYVIEVTDPAAFSASTVGGTGFDTQLFLFRADGLGVAANDDVAFGAPQSRLPAGVLGALPAGRYVLAVTGFDRDPVSASGEIFPDAPTGVVGPTGSGGEEPLRGFTGSGRPGAYTIQVSGAAFAGDGLVFMPFFVDARIANRVDQDEDGFAQRFDLQVDVNANIVGTYLVNVYEDTGGADDDFLVTSETFAVDGTAQDYQGVTIAVDLFRGLPSHGTVAFRLDLIDTTTRAVVETWRPGNDPDLGNVQVELGGEDGALTWIEQDDAGETVEMAQAVVGSGPLAAIRGTLRGGGDADLYLIEVADPAVFSASTEGAGFDSQLFLFRADGTGIAAYDDGTSGTLVSQLPAGTLARFPAATYLLAVSGVNRDAVSVGGGIFPDTQPSGVVGPTGPGGGAPLSGFAGVGAPGAYTIQLTGAASLAVAPPPPPAAGPVAVADLYAALINRVISEGARSLTEYQGSLPAALISVLINDFGLGGLLARLVTEAVHGTLELNLDGSFLYRPDAGYTGFDRFVYEVRDQTGTNAASVYIDVTTVPTDAVEDVYVFGEDSVLRVQGRGVLSNDASVSDTLEATPVSGPAHAAAFALYPDGSFTYEPAANYEGPDSFTYRASNEQGSDETTVSLTVAAVNDPPVATADAYGVAGATLLTVAAAEGVLANDGDVEGDALAAVPVSGPEHGTLELNADGSFAYRAAAYFTGTDRFTYEASDGRSSALAVAEIAVRSPLAVTSLAPTSSGFRARFNEAVDLGALNLHDTQTAGLGPADVTLVGATRGPISGSLIAEATGTLTFVRTGGVLEPDTYTARLRGAPEGFEASGDTPLDGDGDGTPGGDYVATFTVDAPPAVVVSVPDFTRGPGQVVNIPATGSGIPVRVSEMAGVRTVDVTLVYDPSTLTVTGALPGASLPGDAVIQVDVSTPGRAVLHVTLPTPLSGGRADLVNLTAQVPGTAPYREATLLEVENVSLNGGAIAAAADDGVQVVALLGDTTGNGSYSSLDGQRVLRVAVGLDSGFSAYALIDPVIIADITDNGTISSLDGTRILQKAVGLPRPEIPPVPLAATRAASVGTPPAGNPVQGLAVSGRIDGAAALVPVDREVQATSGLPVTGLASGTGWDPAPNAGALGSGLDRPGSARIDWSGRIEGLGLPFRRAVEDAGSWTARVLVDSVQRPDRDDLDVPIERSLIQWEPDV